MVEVGRIFFEIVKGEDRKQREVVCGEPLWPRIGGRKTRWLETEVFHEHDDEDRWSDGTGGDGGRERVRA